MLWWTGTERATGCNMAGSRVAWRDAGDVSMHTHSPKPQAVAEDRPAAERSSSTTKGKDTPLPQSPQPQDVIVKVEERKAAERDMAEAQKSSRKRATSSHVVGTNGLRYS